MAQIQTRPGYMGYYSEAEALNTAARMAEAFEHGIEEGPYVTNMYYSRKLGREVELCAVFDGKDHIDCAAFEMRTHPACKFRPQPGPGKRDRLLVADHLEFARPGRTYRQILADHQLTTRQAGEFLDQQSPATANARRWLYERSLSH